MRARDSSIVLALHMPTLLFRLHFFFDRCTASQTCCLDYQEFCSGDATADFATELSCQGLCGQAVGGECYCDTL